MARRTTLQGGRAGMGQSSTLQGHHLHLRQSTAFTPTSTPGALLAQRRIHALACQSLLVKGGCLC